MTGDKLTQKVLELEHRGMEYAAIGRQLGVSEARVRRIVDRARKRGK